jgi:hypothetical protein
LWKYVMDKYNKITSCKKYSFKCIKFLVTNTTKTHSLWISILLIDLGLMDQLINNYYTLNF